MKKTRKETSANDVEGFGFTPSDIDTLSQSVTDHAASEDGDGKAFEAEQEEPKPPASWRDIMHQYKQFTDVQSVHASHKFKMRTQLFDLLESAVTKNMGPLEKIKFGKHIKTIKKFQSRYFLLEEEKGFNEKMAEFEEKLRQLMQEEDGGGMFHPEEFSLLKEKLLAVQTAEADIWEKLNQELEALKEKVNGADQDFWSSFTTKWGGMFRNQQRETPSLNRTSENEIDAPEIADSSSIIPSGPTSVKAERGTAPMQNSSLESSPTSVKAERGTAHMLNSSFESSPVYSRAGTTILHTIFQRLFKFKLTSQDVNERQQVVRDFNHSAMENMVEGILRRDTQMIKLRRDNQLANLEERVKIIEVLLKSRRERNIRQPHLLKSAEAIGTARPQSLLSRLWNGIRGSSRTRESRRAHVITKKDTSESADVASSTKTETVAEDIIVDPAEALTPYIVKVLERKGIKPVPVRPSVSSDAKVYVLKTIKEADTFVSTIVEISKSKYTIKTVGFDIESCNLPGHTEQVPAVLQIAFSPLLVGVFQIYQMSLPGGPSRESFSTSLRFMLENPAFCKTGVGVQLDNHKLNKFYGIEVKASLDSSVIARLVGVKSRSLAGLYYIYVNSLEPSFKISKSSRSFNWDSEKLDDRALRYAADDALASLKLFKSMFRLPSLKIAPWEKEVHPSFRGDALASLPPPFKKLQLPPTSSAPVDGPAQSAVDLSITSKDTVSATSVENSASDATLDKLKEVVPFKKEDGVLKETSTKDGVITKASEEEVTPEQHLWIQSSIPLRNQIFAKLKEPLPASSPIVLTPKMEVELANHFVSRYTACGTSIRKKDVVKVVGALLYETTVSRKKNNDQVIPATASHEFITNAGAHAVASWLNRRKLQHQNLMVVIDTMSFCKSRDDLLPHPPQAPNPKKSEKANALQPLNTKPLRPLQKANGASSVDSGAEAVASPDTLAVIRNLTQAEVGSVGKVAEARTAAMEKPSLQLSAGKPSSILTDKTTRAAMPSSLTDKAKSPSPPATAKAAPPAATTTTAQGK